MRPSAHPLTANPLRAVALAVSLLSCGCGALTPPRPPAPTSPTPLDEPHAPITLTASPPHPSLWVDGQPRGSLQRLPDQTLHLPAGRRRIELRLDGFYPARADITVLADQPQALHLTLTPRLD